MMAHPPSHPLDAATLLTARGWVVFPADHPDGGLHCLGSPRDCRERRCPAETDPAKRGKHPAVVPRWGALTDPADAATLAEWFGAGTYNVALACGASGLLVVDDDANGGLERYAESIGEKVPDTFRVRTHQGWHHYFTVPRGPDGQRVPVGNAPGLLESWGCDVRGGAGPSGGDGGYVIGPGSTHTSGDPDAYTVPDWEAEAIEAPEWLIHAVTTSGPPRRAEGMRDAAGAAGPGTAPGAGLRAYDELPRYDTADRFLADFHEHCAQVDAPGAAFRWSLFAAARDGWRLVNREVITEDELYRELAHCVRRVWDADPDERDDKIVNEEAYAAALRSPWELITPLERVPVEPDRYGPWHRPGDVLLPDSSAGTVTSLNGDGGHTTDGNRTVDVRDIPSVDTSVSTALVVPPAPGGIEQATWKAAYVQEVTRRAVRAELEAAELPPLKRLSYLDFRATTKPSYLIPKMLYRNALAVVFGAPGSGKTYLMIDIALSLATGRQWQGQRITNADGGPGMVHYVMAEGLDINNGRTEAWEHYHGIAPAEIGDRFVVFEEGIALSEQGIAQYLVEVRRDKPDLVVLDTRNPLFVGKESSGEDYGAMINVLHMIRRAAGGCAVVLLDHSGLNDPDRPRGSNALVAGVHTMIQVTKGRDKDAGIYTARETGRNKAAGPQDGAEWTWRLRKVEDVPHEGLDVPAVCVPLTEDDEAARKPVDVVGSWWDDVDVPDDLLKIRGRGRAMAMHVFRILRWVGGDAGLTRDELSRTITRFLRMNDAKAACTPDQLGRALSLLVEHSVIENAGKSSARFVLTPGYRPARGHGQPPE